MRPLELPRCLLRPRDLGLLPWRALGGPAQPLPQGRMPPQTPVLGASWASLRLPQAPLGLPSSCPLLPPLSSISGLRGCLSLSLSFSSDRVWLLLLGGLELTPPRPVTPLPTTPPLLGLGGGWGPAGGPAQRQLASALHTVCNKRCFLLKCVWDRDCSSGSLWGERQAAVLPGGPKLVAKGGTKGGSFFPPAMLATPESHLACPLRGPARELVRLAALWRPELLQPSSLDTAQEGKLGTFLRGTGCQIPGHLERKPRGTGVPAAPGKSPRMEACQPALWRRRWE